MERDGLLKNIRNSEEKKPLLLCFPYAGGGASAYFKWQKKIGDEIFVAQVQLPGREERYGQTAYTNMDKCISDVMDALITVWGNYSKVFLFGHSMGAKIAYETASRLQDKGLKIGHLFVSGSSSPDSPVKNKIANSSEEEIINELKTYEGVSKEVLCQKEFIQFFLPTIRADFAMIESYQDTRRNVLGCPITGFFGAYDRIVGMAEDEGWNQYTAQEFRRYIYDGSHFFIRDYENEIIAIIRESILCSHVKI